MYTSVIAAKMWPQHFYHFCASVTLIGGCWGLQTILCDRSQYKIYQMWPRLLKLDLAFRFYDSKTTHFSDCKAWRKTPIRGIKESLTNQNRAEESVLIDFWVCFAESRVLWVTKITHLKSQAPNKPKTFL